MAQPLGTVYVDVKGDYDKFGQESKSKFSTIGKVAAGVFAAAFVGKQIFDFGKDAFLQAEAYQSLVDGVGQLVVNQQKALGEAASITTDHVVAQADAIQGLTGVSNEQLLTAQQQLLTFQGLQNHGTEATAVFDRATAALTDMVASGALSDFNSGAIQMGKALQDPIKGVTALSRAGVVFTKEQKNQIATMQQSGDLLGAQTVILDELEKVYGGVAVANRDASAVMKNSLQDLKVAFGDALAPVVSELVPVITTVLVPAMMEVAPLFGDLAQLVVGVLPPVVELIGQLTPLAQKILPVLTKVLSTVLELFMALITPIIDLVLAALTPLLDMLSPLIDELGGALMPAILSVAEVTKALTPLIILLTDLLKPLLAIVGLVAQVVGVLLAGVIREIAKLVSNWVDQIRPLIEFLTRLWSNVEAAMRETLPQMLALFSELPGKIMAVFTGAGTWLIDTGKDLIEGFISGIRSMASKIVKAIRDFVINKIPGPIKSFFGIASPSKLMMEYGAAISEGMAAGIRKSSSQVGSAVDSLLATPTFGIGGNLAAAVPGGAGVTQVFHGPVVGSLEEFSNRVLAAQGREMRYLLGS